MKWKYPGGPVKAFTVDLTGNHDKKCFACCYDSQSKSEWRYMTEKRLAQLTGSNQGWMCLKHWKKYRKYRNININEAQVEDKMITIRIAPK